MRDRGNEFGMAFRVVEGSLNLTHSVVSERIDSVNENVRFDPKFSLTEHGKRSGGLLKLHL